MHELLRMVGVTSLIMFICSAYWWRAFYFCTKSGCCTPYIPNVDFYLRCMSILGGRVSCVLTLALHKRSFRNDTFATQQKGELIDLIDYTSMERKDNLIGDYG